MLYLLFYFQDESILQWDIRDFAENVVTNLFDLQPPGREIRIEFESSPDDTKTPPEERQKMEPLEGAKVKFL